MFLDLISAISSFNIIFALCLIPYYVYIIMSADQKVNLFLPL
jgi:hypothetical protein